MRSDQRPAANNPSASAPRLFGLVLLILPGIALYRLSARFDPGLWLAGLAAINAICFVVYWHDKRRAGSGGWRIPESTLHLLELAGARPAALVAQQLFRHKTAKFSYQFVFWCIVTVHQFLALDYLLGWRISHRAWQLVAG